MKYRLFARLAVGALVVAFCAAAPAGTDPLSYYYQQYPNDAPEVWPPSFDSYAWNTTNENADCFSRRGKVGWKGTDDVNGGYAERAYIPFDASAIGDNDKFLEYNEDFDFSFDFNIQSFAAGTDEWIMLGMWYDPADGGHPFYLNLSKFLGLEIESNGGRVFIMIRFGNGGNGGGRGMSSDLTGAASLATDTNYRFEGHYRYHEWPWPDYDPNVHLPWQEILEQGHIYGTLTDLDTMTLVGEVTEEMALIPTVPQSPCAYVYDYLTNNADFPYWSESWFGVGNYTVGTIPAPNTYDDGPIYTTDNWYLASGAEVLVDEAFTFAGPGDVDKNGVVDGLDLTAVLTAWETEPGDPLWNPDADLDENDIVDGLDLTEVISNWTVASAAAAPEAADSDSKPGRGNGRGKGNVKAK